MLWLGGFAMPFAMTGFLGWSGHEALAAELHAQWRSAGWLVTAIVATAGVTILTLMIRTGGTAHDASYAAGRRLGRVLGAGFAGSARGTSASCWGPLGRAATSPYAAWVRHLLARRDGSVMSRLLVGLGPATHWTSRLFECFWFLMFSGGLCALVASLAGAEMRAAILPWFAFSIVTGICSPALQAVPKLYQTRREQALLVLLPGVPRGVRLNRWLAWQMSLTFVVGASCGLVLAWALAATASGIERGMADRATSGMLSAVAAALLPQVAWQWRCWARLRAGGSDQSWPVLAPFVLGLAFLALHAGTGVGFLPLGVTSTAASLAWCAWRWHRMASEPTALPVGRLD